MTSEVPFLSVLPMDAHVPALLAALDAHRNLVLTAEPGAGKTTRVPRALLDAGLLGERECWVLEPRRLAVRLAAVRVADELGEKVGERVGYAVRFEQQVSVRTRIRFVTEGLLLRSLQSDPHLKRVGTVILDEFHERHLQTDVALAALLALQRRARPDLKLVIMSATLDSVPIAEHVQAATLHCAGRQHPVSVRHAPRQDDRPLALKVREAVESLLEASSHGHILVFLPGAKEIRACQEVLEGRGHGVTVHALHGSLSLAAQQQAIAPSEGRKVILSTNVAESSLTVEGVMAVVDSGLGREARHSPWSGLSRLDTCRISQARCVQRAGRAGRQGPGVCVRLYTAQDFASRPEQDVPEIRRTDLAEVLLMLGCQGVPDPGALPWLEAPPAVAWEAAQVLLTRLGALDKGGMTELGRRMAALPLHPRLARLVVAGQDQGISYHACLAAVLLEAGNGGGGERLALPRPSTPGGEWEADLWGRMDDYLAAQASGREGPWRQVARSVEALQRALGGRCKLGGEVAWEDPLRYGLLTAYVDRLAKRGGAGTYALLGGGGARLGPESRVQADLIVALEADERRRGTSTEVVISAAAKVDLEGLLEVAPDRLVERRTVSFQSDSGRVECRDEVFFEDLCLESRRRPAEASDPATAEALCQGALNHAVPPALESLLERLAFVSRVRSDLAGEEENLKASLLQKACEGQNSLKGLEAVSWEWVARSVLGEERHRLLEHWAPTHVTLPRRRVVVHYGGETPWIASRLQDFFGMVAGPCIGGGAVPLVLHLLAPNQRAVQVTTDLAGFWQRAYQELRPALSRRYPKHPWPDKPGEEKG